MSYGKLSFETRGQAAADEGRFYSNRRAYLAGEPDFGRLVSAITLT